MNKIPKYQPNILHKYPSWTYNLALYPIPYGGNFQGSTNTDGAYEFPPKKDLNFKRLRPIIASGYKTVTPLYSPSYGTNFYFDKLTFSNTVSNNAASKMANTTAINISIIETYGVSLIDKLLETGKKCGYVVNSKMVPFALVIEFFAIDETTGAPVLTPVCKPKVMYITIGDISTRLSNRGAEYQITAFPYSQLTLSESVTTLPTAVSVEAATVNEFFGSYHKLLNDGGIDYSDIGTYTKTLSAALNKRQDKAVADRRMNYPNEYVFYFHPEIGNSRLLDVDLIPHTMLANLLEIKSIPAEKATGQTTVNQPVTVTEQSTATTTVSDPSAPTVITTGKPATVITSTTLSTQQTTIPPATSQAASSCVGLQRGKVNAQTKTREAKDDVSTTDRKILFQLNRGMSIPDIITMVVCSSEYIRKQITEPTHNESSAKNAPDPNNPKAMDWFKILPIVVNLESDESMGTMSQRYEFTVDKYKIYQTQIPNAPMSIPPQPVKEYNYIYTGKNKDVLNFDLNFANLYKTYCSEAGVATSAASGPVKKEQVEKPNLAKENADNRAKSNDINSDSSPSSTLTGTTQIHQSMPTTDAKGQTVANFLKTQLERSVDSLTVDLKIVGDPDYIKQDDIRYQSFWSEHGSDGKYAQSTEFEGITYDKESVYIVVNFNTIVDYSADGIAATNAKSSFSGLYKILQVEHSFQGGKFEQTLKIARHTIQETKIDPAVVNNKT
jgi:hypothetical protein